MHETRTFDLLSTIEATVSAVIVATVVCFSLSTTLTIAMRHRDTTAALSRK
jgi:hypothetical protein